MSYCLEPRLPSAKMPWSATHSIISSKVWRRVGLEHDAFPRAPAACVHLHMPAHRELVLVVMRVEFRAQIDVALGALERAGVFAQVLDVGIAMHHHCHHEGGVDDLTEIRAARRSNMGH